MAAGSEVARESVVRLAEFFGSAVDLIFVMILSFYFASVGESIAHWLQTETPPSSTRYRAQVLVAVVNRVVGGYIRGTLMLAIIIGVLLGAGLAVIGVQYAVLLGVLQFFMQFILILGVIITGTAAVVITLANVLLLLTSIRSTASHLSRKNGVRTDTIVPQDCES